MADNPFNLNTEEMMQASVHFGHRVSKLHPKMKPFISGTKNNVHIIELKSTVENFEKALVFVKNTIAGGKNLLIVGTKVPFKELVKKTAQDCGLPYVNTRWLGGTFTNFETILKRINYFKDLVSQKEKGVLEKYTKKERIKINKEIEGLYVKFEGIKDMTKLPEAVLILDMKKDITAAREARKKGIKIIAVCDTNIDPDSADYPIPANDDAISSIKYLLAKFEETILKAKQENKKE
jgi:small subunit ribosomal protein S2